MGRLERQIVRMCLAGVAWVSEVALGGGAYP